MEYTRATEVYPLATEIISAYHEHLLPIRIEYAFVSPTPKQKGALILGHARILRGLSALWASEEGQDFFVVVLARNVWERGDDAFRRALLDHELCHCKVTDEGKLVTIGHDVEEFSEVIQRHGLWKEDIRTFMDELKQQDLFIPDMR